MIDVTISVVPPGGGEQDYCLKGRLPGVPNHGDYVSFLRKEEKGAEDFIVRRTWWILKGDPSAFEADLTVEVEFAVGPYSTKSHKEACERHTAEGRLTRRFDDSAY